MNANPLLPRPGITHDAGLSDVEHLLADTGRVSELEHAGVDGFDRSLIPRVEWL